MTTPPKYDGKRTAAARPKVLGRHWLVEFYGCPASAIVQTDTVEEAMLHAAKAAEATIVSCHFHQFNPHGVSGVIIIQESHLTVHTWPEYGFVALDIFTCGTALRTEKAIAYLQKAWIADRVTVRELERGVEE